MRDSLTAQSVDARDGAEQPGGWRLLAVVVRAIKTRSVVSSCALPTPQDGTTGSPIAGMGALVGGSRGAISSAAEKTCTRRRPCCAATLASGHLAVAGINSMAAETPFVQRPRAAATHARARHSRHSPPPAGSGLARRSGTRCTCGYPHTTQHRCCPCGRPVLCGPASAHATVQCWHAPPPWLASHAGRAG